MPRTGNKGGSSGSRQPDYQVAMRIARIVSEMPGHPFGWALEDVADYLGVHERTVRRYIKALGEEFADEEGRPLFRIEKRGDELRLVRKEEPRDEIPESVYHLISVHLSLEFFRMLGENVVAISVEDVYDRARKRLSPKERDLLRDLDRKFYTAPYAPRDYSGHVDVLEEVIKAIVYQYRVKMVYKPGGSEPWTYTVEPYTLLFHKGGFYMIGKPEERKLPVYFNVERIKSLELTRDKFAYPKSYHPDQLLDGAFGIFAGPVKTFKLKFPAELKDYITGRRWHKTQNFDIKKDGSVVLTMKVTDSEEVRSWIRSFGGSVNMLK